MQLKKKFVCFLDILNSFRHFSTFSAWFMKTLKCILTFGSFQRLSMIKVVCFFIMMKSYSFLRKYFWIFFCLQIQMQWEFEKMRNSFLWQLFQTKVFQCLFYLHSWAQFYISSNFFQTKYVMYFDRNEKEKKGYQNEVTSSATFTTPSFVTITINFISFLQFNTRTFTVTRRFCARIFISN